MPVRELEVPKSLHHLIVGKGGSTLKSLQTELSVVITLPRPEETNNQTIVLNAQTKETLDRLQDRLQQILKINIGSKLVTSHLKVPKDQHHIIIGKKGATIQELQQKCHALISIPGTNDNSDLITVQGVEESVLLVEAEIKHLCKKADIEIVKKTTTTSVPIPKINLSGEKIAEALFFPNEGNIDKIIAYLDSCEKSLDVCVYTITDDRLTQQMVKLHRRGVKVRVITDDEKSVDIGSDIATLSHAGISVRMDQGSTYMHHKFAILDNLVLMTGSFNWTRAASQSNQENIIFSGEKTLVSAFVKEYNKLWEQFKNN